MLGLALKWLTRALFVLVVFCALTALYMLYELQIGSCKDGGETCFGYVATLYAAGLGVFGFSISGIAAHLIGKSFRAQD